MKFFSYLFKLTLVTIYFFACSNDNKSKPQKLVSKKYNTETILFKDNFHLESEIVINGSKEHPVYSLQDFMIFEEQMYVLDKVNHQVHVFDNNGNRITQWGKKGKGPGEFLSADRFVTETDSLIYVLDSSGNFRVQGFTKDGKLRQTFPLRSVGPFTNSYFIKQDVRKALVTTTIANCDEKPYKSCVIQLLDVEGNVLNNFAMADKVQPTRIGVSFFSVYHNEFFFIVHFLGDAIATYDQTGNYKKHFTIQNSSQMKRPNLDRLPSDVMKQVQMLNNSSYTSIIGLFANDDYLIIENLRNGTDYENAPTRYFLEFYDFDGTHVYTGMNTPFKLMQVEGDQFYFVDYDEKSEYGNIIVQKYLFKIDDSI